MTPPARRGRPSAISTIGLTGAPPAAAPLAPPAPEPPAPSDDHDVTTSRRHEPATSRPRDVKAPRPRDVKTSPPGETAGQRVTRPVSYTVRLSEDEADDADDLTRALRRATRRRRLDRSEVTRALLSLARTDDAVRALLVERLRAPGE